MLVCVRLSEIIVEDVSLETARVLQDVAVAELKCERSSAYKVN